MPKTEVVLSGHANPCKDVEDSVWMRSSTNRKLPGLDKPNKGEVDPIFTKPCKGTENPMCPESEADDKGPILVMP